MRARRGCFVLAVAAVLPALALPAAASPTFVAPSKFIRLAIVVVPDADVSAVATGGEQGWGLGVFPDSRDALDFFDAAGAGAPLQTAGRPSPLEGRRCALRDALEASRVSRFIGFVGTGFRDGTALMERLLCEEGRGLFSNDPDLVPTAALAAVAAPNARTATEALREWRQRNYFADGATVLITGGGATTPVPLAFSTGAESVLAGGMARRPLIATPYDVSATILSRLAVPRPPSGFIGRVLDFESADRAFEKTAALAERLERDAGYGPAVAGATIGVLLGGGVVLPGLLLLLAMTGAMWASPAAVRAARGAAAAVGGYVASLFVATGNAGLRTIPIVVAFVAAFARPGVEPARERRRIGRTLLVVSAGIAALTILAAIRPGGEPALSLYGNPLESWRLFGLRNHLTSMMGLGMLCAAVAFGKPVPVVIAAAGVAGVFVVGAAFLGANFVAVLTLTLGAGLVTWICARKRIEPLGLIVAGALSIVAFGAALLADAGSPATHGGQAVRRVRSAGFDAAWDFLRIRWDLNVESIGSIWGGWVWTAGLVAGLITLMAWAVRSRSMEAGPRAVLFGGGAAATAALILEDTGFLTGGILALAPALVAVTVVAERLRPLPSSPERGVAEADTRSRQWRSARR